MSKMIFPILCPECLGRGETYEQDCKDIKIPVPPSYAFRECKACNGDRFVRVSQDWVDGLEVYPKYVAVS
jgi:hypothetical protein